MTVRLLKPYAQRPANALATFDASIEAGLIAAKQASADLTGGVKYFVPRAGLTLQSKQIAVGSVTLKMEEQTTVLLPEGQVLLVTGAALTVGAIARSGSSDNWVVGTGALAPIGPYVGMHKFLLTCDSGSIVAKVQEASLTVSGGAAAPTITGSFQIGQTITASLPAGVVGTLQFTRTMTSTPFTKSNIATAVANAVNSLSYQIQQADAGFSVGCDASNLVSPAAGGIVPGSPATAPGQPAKPVLTAMAGAVSIAWTPGAAGSTPTTGNVWTDINGNTTALTTNPQVITAPGGTPYTGTVKTQNAQGFGPPSVQADVVTVAAVTTKIVNGTVRGKIPFTTGQFSTSFPVKYYRTLCKSNVAVKKPRPTVTHGYVATPTGEERGCNPTLPSTTTVDYEYSILTNINGGAIDQSAATLTRGTYFLMGADPAFLAAGGSVSSDGLVAHVPEKWLVQADPLPFDLVPGQKYIEQYKIKGANGVRHPANISSHAAGIGDLIYNAAGEAGPGSTGDLINSKNWAGVSAPAQFGATLASWMMLGEGTADVFGVNGDSIANGIGGDSTLGLTSEDLGDADGVQNFVKRGLNALGKSFIDTSASGTSIRMFRDTFPETQNGWRMWAFTMCDHAIQELGPNDRSDLHPYYASAGLGTLTEWMTAFLRTKMRNPNAKVIGCTMPPATFCTIANTAITSSGTTATATTASTTTLSEGQIVTIAGAVPTGFNVLNAAVHIIDSTHYSYTIADLGGVSATTPGTWADGWATEANQRPKNGDCTWPTLGEAATTGQMFTYNDRTMRRNSYAGLPYGGAAKEYDGGFDWASYCSGTNGGLIGVNGTRYWKGDDGTHFKPLTCHVPAAAAFVTAFPSWFPG